MLKVAPSLAVLVGCLVSGVLVPAESHAQVSVSSTSLEMSGPVSHATVADLAAQLRRLVGAEEQYFRQHGSYTSDLAALHLWDLASQADSWLQVIYAGGRSWSGRAVLSGNVKKSCVIFVGELKDSPQAPVTEADHVVPVIEGEPKCDR